MAYEGLTYTCTSESGFESGLTITLYEGGELVGKFSVVKDEEGYANDVEVVPNKRGQGFGVVLLLLAIFESDRRELGFEQDHRGTTGAQKAVYDSAEREGLIETVVMGTTRLTGEGESKLEDLGLI
jgi:GNAT superfamily N-acetyltransferase